MTTVRVRFLDLRRRGLEDSIDDVHQFTVAPPFVRGSVLLIGGQWASGEESSTELRGHHDSCTTSFSLEDLPRVVRP